MTTDTLLSNLTTMLTFNGPANSVYAMLSSLFFYMNTLGIFTVLALTIKEIFIKIPLRRHPEEDKS
jgi:hypothetical protein